MALVTVSCQKLFPDNVQVNAFTLDDLKRVLGSMLDCSIDWNNRGDVEITNGGQRQTVSYTGDTYLMDGDKVVIRRANKSPKKK